MSTKYKLTATISRDRERHINRQVGGIDVMESTVRQLTWDNGLEATVTMWADGKVNFIVKELNTDRVVREMTVGPAGEEQSGVCPHCGHANPGASSNDDCPARNTVELTGEANHKPHWEWGFWDGFGHFITSELPVGVET